MNEDVGIRLANPRKKGILSLQQQDGFHGQTYLDADHIGPAGGRRPHASLHTD